MEDMRTVTPAELVAELRRGSSVVYVLCDQWYQVIGGQECQATSGAVFELKAPGGGCVPALSCRNDTALTVAVYAAP